MLIWCFFVLFVFGENRQPLCVWKDMNLDDANLIRPVALGTFSA